MKFLRIFLLYFQSIFEYKSRAFVWFLIALLNPLVVLLFWYASYLSGNRIADWGIDALVGYYLIQIILRAMLWAHPGEEVALIDIQEGNLLKYLLKPSSYFLYKLFEDLPWRILQAVFGIIIVSILYFTFGIRLTINNEVHQFLWVFSICINAYALSYLSDMILGFSAFWLTDYRGLQQVTEVLFIIFAGTVMPLSLFPPLLKTISFQLPYAYMLYFPILAVQGKLSDSEIASVLIMQFIWMGILAVVCKYVWSRGLKTFTGVSN